MLNQVQHLVHTAQPRNRRLAGQLFLRFRKGAESRLAGVLRGNENPAVSAIAEAYATLPPGLFRKGRGSVALWDKNPSLCSGGHFQIISPYPA